jgi:hypothetical protein
MLGRGPGVESLPALDGGVVVAGVSDRAAEKSLTRGFRGALSTWRPAFCLLVNPQLAVTSGRSRDPGRFTVDHHVKRVSGNPTALTVPVGRA